MRYPRPNRKRFVFLLALVLGLFVNRICIGQDGLQHIPEGTLFVAWVDSFPRIQKEARESGFDPIGWLLEKQATARNDEREDDAQFWKAVNTIDQALKEELFDSEVILLIDRNASGASLSAIAHTKGKRDQIDELIKALETVSDGKSKVGRPNTAPSTENASTPDDQSDAQIDQSRGQGSAFRKQFALTKEWLCWSQCQDKLTRLVSAVESGEPSPLTKTRAFQRIKASFKSREQESIKFFVAPSWCSSTFLSSSTTSLVTAPTCSRLCPCSGRTRDFPAWWESVGK